MNLEFINNLTEISQKQLDFAYEAAYYLTLSASVYFILFGNVLSVSNMIGDILKDSFSESSRQKLTFISGLIFFSALVKTLYHEHLTDFQPYDSPSYTQSTSAVRLIIAGLLVGFGSQYAKVDSNNSFSLDGIPKFSVKSIVGNVFVIVTGCLTHTYQLHKYLPQTPRIIDISLPDNISYTAYLLVFLLIPFICFVISAKKSFKALVSYISLFVVGLIYAYGLMFGGFTERKQTYKYMMLDEKWNPSMIVIYGYGLLVSSFVYLLMRFLIKKPVFGTEITKDNTPFKFHLILGAIIYGVGWGLGGLRSASVLVLMPLQSIKIVFYWGLACLIGMKLVHKVFEAKPVQPLVQKAQ